jgi:hypothetical protein
MAMARGGRVRGLGMSLALVATLAGPWVASAAGEGAATTSTTTSTTTTTSTPPTTTSTTTTTTPTTTSTTAPTTTSTTIASATVASPTSSTTTTASVTANGVTENKSFTVEIVGTTGAAPNTWAGDVDATLSVTITNRSPSQSLGSLNLTVPAPYALISSPADSVPGGPVVEVRNLDMAPGGSKQIELVVAVNQCTSVAPAPFAVTAKQSNDYNGVGNDFTLAQASDMQVDVVGTCALVWSAEPSDAERGSAITSEAWNPNGEAIAVKVVDGGGVDRATRAQGSVTLAATNANVASPVLGGTTSADIVEGLATFTPGPTLAPSAFDYVLTAASPNLISTDESADFDIVDQEVNCPAGGACNGSATTSAGRFSATARFGAGGSATHLTVSINAGDTPTFACAGYPRGDLPVTQFVFTGEGDPGADRDGTFSTSIAGATRPLNSYEVCWAAPYEFKTESGAWAQIGARKPGTGEDLYVGLLPDCARRGAPARPCVTRSFDSRTRTVTIVVSTTGQDPWKY